MHFQGGPNWIYITCSGQMRDLNPLHILAQVKSSCFHLPSSSSTCPNFLQASTWQSLTRTQEITQKLSGTLTSWPYISLFLLSLVLTMKVSSTGCHELSHNQQECLCRSRRNHGGDQGCDRATVRKASRSPVPVRLVRMALLC